MKALPQPRLLFLISEDWYFWSHRRSIARAAQSAGFEVLIATRVHKHGKLIEQEGFRLIPIRLQRSSHNPFEELLTIGQLVKIYRRERPSIVHHVALKPVLYGSLAAKISGIPSVVNALAGLGFLFVGSGWASSVLRHGTRLLYRVALNNERSRVIFQNPEDLKDFVDSGIVPAHRAVLIRGAGVDPVQFYPQPELNGTPVVMMAGRLLWNKGVGELVEAVERIRERGAQCRLVLVGIPDPENPMSVPESTLHSWQLEGKAEWWGRREDMPEVLAQATLVVLPTTYGEGVPKVLLEAAASGRAVIATDVPGCREIIRHGENGLLVPPHDLKALTEAIETLLRFPALRAQMGIRSREIAVTEFSEAQVVRETLAVYWKLLGE